MQLSPEDTSFLDKNHAAAMITIGRDGMPKVARVGIALVDGKLLSSSTEERSRTKRLRRDPRCTLFVFDADQRWMALECHARILEGPEVPRQSVQLLRVMQEKPDGPVSWFSGEMDDQELERTLVEEGRVLFEFEVQRTYGMR